MSIKIPFNPKVNVAWIWAMIAVSAIMGVFMWFVLNPIVLGIWDVAGSQYTTFHHLNGTYVNGTAYSIPLDNPQTNSASVLWVQLYNNWPIVGVLVVVLIFAYVNGHKRQGEESE